MQVEILADSEAVSKRAAALIAAEARAAVAARGRFNVAFSGGHDPWIMLRYWTKEDVPWDRVQIFQIDERVAPAGDPDRNLTHLQASLENAPLRPDQIHAMPVELPELEGAASQYEQTLRNSPGILPCLISLIWAWAPTATPRRWCRAILCLTFPIAMLLLQACTWTGGA